MIIISRNQLHDEVWKEPMQRPDYHKSGIVREVGICHLTVEVREGQ